MPFLTPNQQRQSTEGELGEPVPEDIHPLTLILIINHPLSASSIYYDHGILPVQFMCLLSGLAVPSVGRPYTRWLASELVN